VVPASRRPGEELVFFPRPGRGHVIICINEGGYWKFAVGESRRAGGAAVKRRGAVPLLADRVEELDTWTMSVS
jgi:hypothetical protein